MAKGPEALVEPEILIWARDKARFSVEEAANKIGVKSERLIAWEAGELRPTVAQLRKLANAYKRPLSVLYLSTPPEGFAPLREFRRLPGVVSGTQSPELAREIRIAYERRSLALELFSELHGDPPDLPLRISVNDDPEELSSRIRSFLELPFPEQPRWTNSNQAFNFWRDKIESLGILVFMISDVDTEEARAFSITNPKLPVIAINRKEYSDNTKIFSLFHELIHLFLGVSGLCDIDETYDRPPEEQRIEVFCNHTAAATLMPRENMLNHPTVRAKAVNDNWEEEEILSIAKLFRVSREAMLRRLLTLGRTTEEFYAEKRRDYREEHDQRMRLPRRKIIIQRHRKQIASTGRLFARLAFDNFYQNKITSSDLSNYLQLKTKHFQKVENALWGRNIKFGE